MEGNQQKAPGHGDVFQGSREELEATEGGKDAEDHGGGLSDIWENFGGGIGS